MGRCSRGGPAKQIIILVICIISLVSLFLWSCRKEVKEPVVLILTNWRGDVHEVVDKINEVFIRKNPQIRVKYEFVPRGTEYDDELIASLEAGVGPDIMFLRAYEVSQGLYEKGYLQKLNGLIPGLEEYPEAALQAWQTEEGHIYGVPVASVGHGVYFNKEIFARNNLSPPRTWDEFLTVCKKLKDNGYIPLAQGIRDEWTLYEVVFSGLGPNLYGGEKSRQKLMQGQLKLTDEPFLTAFRELKKLQEFFPDGYQVLNYAGMRHMFGSGRAAMFIGGSWELFIFEKMKILDKIDWFPPPLQKSTDRLQYCLHVDAGVGVNSLSGHPDEALSYLKWVSTPEFAQLYMDLNVGYFTFTPSSTDYSHTNELAKKMLDAAKNADITMRPVWEKLSAQSPGGNMLMGEALKKLYSDIYTPEQAAAYVQQNIASWYKPFQEN